MGEENGPKWHKDGWVYGWKLWVRDLPADVSRAALGHNCAGHVDVAVQSNKTPSSAACAVVTSHDLGAASKAFEELAMAKLHHGKGQMLWPTVAPHLWHSQWRAFATGLATARVLVGMWHWLLLIRLTLCVQDAQALPNQIWLGAHDVLHDLDILRQPCIAMA